MNVHSDLKSIGSAAASSTKGLYLKNFRVKNISTLYSKSQKLFTPKRIFNVTCFYCTHSSLKKNLSIQSSKDEIYVLDTIDHYWIYPAKQFFSKGSSLSAIYDSFCLAGKIQ